MSDPPLRRRDRHGGLNRDYFLQPPSPELDPRYHASQSPPRSRHFEDPAPRRHKSERRRPATPDLVDDPYYEKPPRRHGRREPRPEVVNPPMPPPSGGGGGGGGGSRRAPPRDPYVEPREYRPRHSERTAMPPPGRDPYDPYMMSGGAGPPPGYVHDPRDGRPPRGHRGEPEPDHRPRRSRHSPPPPEPRARVRDPYEHRGHPRDYPPPRQYSPSPPLRYRSPSPPRRHRSHRGGPPPAAYAAETPRGRPPPASSGRHRSGGGGAPARRSSMPASTKARVNSWWHNPLVQAGARTAFTAGAQAAMKSKDDAGPWMGQKGAKVATAALSAAFMDSLMGGGK